MYGYVGKLLFVNLTDRTYTVEDLKEEDARNFVGGPGLGAKILFERMEAKTPVFAPESMIGFVTGPSNCNGALLGGRYSFVSKSPVSGGWNDSNSGGHFGPKLKRAGYDAVFVTGASEEPVYIFIDNGAVEFRDASHLWGKTTEATEQAIYEELGDKSVGIALISPAGERMNYLAAVMNDTHRAAARGGPGAVMGSKKLKALVVKGNTQVPVFDRKSVIEISKEVVDWEKNGPAAPQNGLWSEFGTNGDYNSCIYRGDAGIKNWSATSTSYASEEEVNKLDTHEMDKIYPKKKYACDTCSLGCGALYNVPSKKYDLSDTSRPEYETTAVFGSMVMNTDPVIMNECNYLCNEYGYDTISAGATIAWLAECYNKGLFTKEELGGVDLSWGNGEAVRTILEMMCADEGIGHYLNNGSREAAKALGKGEEYLVICNGVEPPMHDPRWAPGLGRTYCFDPTPGRHMKGGLGPGSGFAPPEVKYDYDGQTAADISETLETEILNAGGFCNFSLFGFPPGTRTRYLNAICDFKYTDEEVKNLGARLFAIRQAFNLREGITRKELFISERLKGNPPLPDGPTAGITIDLERMGDNFYNALGWDPETGMIPKEMLEKYGGLESVIETFYPEN